VVHEKTIQDLLHEALGLGGDFAEIFIENRFNRSFGMIGGKLESALQGRDFGLGIRIYFGLNSIYTYTNQLKKDHLLEMIRQAVYLKKNNPSVRAVPFRHVIPEDVHQIRHRRIPSEREKIDLMRLSVSGIHDPEGLIQQVRVNYIDYEQRVTIANSDGLFVEDERLRTRLSVGVSALFQGEVQTGHMSQGAFGGFSFYEGINPADLGRESARIAMTTVKAGHAPRGNMPVIIDKGFGGVLFHEASGHGLEATSVAKGISVYSGKVGTQVASPLVTAIDDGTIKGAWGSSVVDDEGTPTKRNVLIEKGVLKGYMIDRFGGLKMGEASTGSARRESYKYEPTSRMTNTFIDQGESDFDEIIEDTEYGLYAKYMGGGSVNPATGEFNFAVMEGYMVRGGKIAEPVRGATLIGRGFDVLKNIDKVGNNLAYGQGMCGSVSGSVPVNVGQPTLRVKSITVGGR